MKLIDFFNGVSVNIHKFFRATGVNMTNTTYYANAKTIYDFWIDVGLTPEQSCGMLAQADAESSLDPKAFGDKGHAYGLHQIHMDRIVLIRDGNSVYDGCGIDISTFPPLEDQLNGVWWELQNSKHKALAFIQSAKTATEAGSLACQYYEVPGAPGQLEKRGVLAQKWFDYFN